MAGDMKDKTSSKANAEKKKAGTLAKASDIVRGFPGDDNFKLVVKGIFAAAALLSLLLLIIAGADLRPSAVVQGVKGKYAFTHASGDGFPVDITGGRIIRASGVTKGTAVLTNTKCLIYDGKGREVISVNHDLASPAMESDGEYILLFDSMGKDYTLRNLSDEICNGKTENSIICADISRSGRFALVTNSETNNARLIVYSPEGKVLHKWKSVSYKISDVAISPSGKYIALCGFSSQKGVLVSTVILQQVGAKENLKEFTFENTLIADIAFHGNSEVVAIGDDLAAYLSVKKDNNKIYDYAGKTLNCYDLSEKGELALVFSGHSDGRNSSVVVIDSSCLEKAKIETAMTSPYVNLGNGQIHLLHQSGVSSYNYKGKLLKQSEVQADCQSIFTSEGRLLAEGIMYLSEIG